MSRSFLDRPIADLISLSVSRLTLFEELAVKSVNSDLFLPDSLRRALGIVDNARRFARDAYALSVLAATRADLHLISGRRDSEGYPLTPSRLVFATDNETAARRVVAYSQSPEDAPAVRQWLGGGASEPSESGDVVLG